ncbi:MAG: hypothetical protein KGY76_05645 [Candidatus Thermoplasmatota archaeon]|nr:hypothetical protein [Candidatus Thermoplasmatota archaeon]
MALLVTGMILLSGTASALDYSVSTTDPEGDTEGQLTNTDVDITSIASEKSGEDIVFTIEVAGDIKEGSTDKHYSYIFVITESESKDQNRLNRIIYEDGEGSYRIDGGADQDLPTAPSVSGDTLEMSVPESAFSELSSFHLYAEAQYTEHQGDNEYKICRDEALGWSTSDSGGDSDTDGDDTDDGLPGFTSTLLFSAAVVAVAIYYQKKR